MIISRFFKCTFLALALFTLIGSSLTLARPEMTGQSTEERFAAMDADKDGKITREEFFKAQPQMKEGAFIAIDTDADGVITLEEWKTFITGHAMGNEPHPAKAGDNALLPAPAHNATMK